MVATGVPARIFPMDVCCHLERAQRQDLSPLMLINIASRTNDIYSDLLDVFMDFIDQS